MSHQYDVVVKKTNGFLECIKESVVSRLREVTPPLLCLAEAAAGVLCPVLGSLVQERVSSRGLQRWLWAWSISLMRKGCDLGHILEETRKGSYQHLKTSKGLESSGCSRALFSGVQRQESGYRLGCRKFYANVEKNFFVVRVTEHLHRLPGEVVEHPFLEISKAIWALSLLSCVAHCRELASAGFWTQWSLEVCYNSLILLDGTWGGSWGLSWKVRLLWGSWDDAEGLVEQVNLGQGRQVLASILAPWAWSGLWVCLKETFCCL